MKEVIQISQAHDIAHTPTLSAVDATLQAESWTAWRQSEEMRLWLPHARDGIWSAEVGFNPVRFMKTADFDLIRAASQKQRETVKALFEAGISIHTGTDANAPNLVPGASLQREIVLLAKAGLSAEQALEASTRVSASFLGIERAGELTVGAPADLVLFRKNPLEDLSALTTLEGVAQAGRLYSERDLMDRLARYQAHHKGTAFRYGLMPALRGILRISTGLAKWFASD
ncbi:MAG: amidohydrolase family protein [Myxococcota bacterium]